jgi:NADP-dependent 3-hydroxy acid dehydrogenase YdfG
MLQSLSPGLVRTEMPPQTFLDNCPSLNPEDIADGVLYVLGAPAQVQVCSDFGILILLLHAMKLYLNILW